MQRFRDLTVLLLAFALGGVLAADEGKESSAAPRDRSHTLRLGGLTFDPTDGEPALPDGWKRSSLLAADLHLVQFDGPIPPGALALLRDRGLQPVRYVHPNSYVVWGQRSALAKLQRVGAVRWTGDFAPGYRVLPQWRELSDEAVEARVLVYRGGDPASVLQRFHELQAVLTVRRIINEELEVMGFTLAGDRLKAAASIPGVYSIQLQSSDAGSRAEVASQISAGNIDGSNIAFPGYLSWLSTLGLDGSGVTVASVDEGVDEDHPDLTLRMLPCAGDSCSTTASEHGTHTAGVIVGDGTSGVIDADGFLQGLGAAPGANLIEQVWRPTFEEPGGMLKLITESHANGAIVSNNSWGTSSIAKGYDIDTLLIDAGVRDADPDAAGNQPMIYVQAIANGAGGVSSQGTPDDAKNTFTIGSTVALTAPETQSPDIDNLSVNTAHGPALDGRTIPHLVAPGCAVVSTQPETIEGFGYAGRCGTSQAAAHVSGSVALFVDYYRGVSGSGADPSPALVKAAFLPAAHDLEGALDADAATMGHRPDSHQGWGRLDLAAVLDPAEPVLYFDQTQIFDFSGQEWAREVTAANPSLPMRVMLVWTDAPGHGLGGNTPAWNNDLDLVVETAGQTYLGNDFGVDGFSTTGGSPDGMNNAEGVFLPTVAGNATLRVAATNINSNGVPQFGDKTDQDFALVCYNCVLVPDFALSSDPEVLEICAPQSSSIDIEVEQIAGFTDPVTLSATGVPAGAVESFDVNPVAPGGTSLLTLDPGTAVTGDYTLQVQGDAPSLTRSMAIAVRLRTSAPASPSQTLPLDAAIDVDPRPVLSWDADPWVSRYLVEVASDAAFLDIVYHAVEENTSHTLDRFLDQQVTYYWRVRATNACGYGGISPIFSFTTADLTDLLLVDDDYDVPNEQPEYTAVLDALGVAYDVWDVWAIENQLEPDAETLARYDRIIWFTGKEEIFAGPNDDSEKLLPEWLDQGSCLLISSIDYVLQHKGVTPFMQQRLGVASAVEDTGQALVTGQGAVFGGLGPYALGNMNPDFRDSVTPDVTAELAFAGDVGDAGVSKDGGWYRTSFLGFGIESAGSGDKQPIIDAFLNWCGGLDAVDGDVDGVSNGADCAPGDADAWTTPSPITDLALGKRGVGFSWSQPVSGSGSSYDVLRSGNPTDFYNAACVTAETTATTAPPDTEIPVSGGLFYYLVGAKSSCGLSTLGDNPDGTPRYGTACDAERIWW